MEDDGGASHADTWLGPIAAEVLAKSSIAETIGARPELRPTARSSLASLPRIPLGADEPPGTGPAIGSVGELILIGELGEGGMGRVLLARQRALGRDVAVKVLHEGAGLRNAAALLAEGRITGLLEHPNIVPVHALGVDEAGAPVLVMKRIDGVQWTELLGDEDHVAWTKLGAQSADRLRFHLEVLMSVCNALHFAHSRGVVHRDLKPENVMIGAFGEVYLTDWGIATTRSPGARTHDEKPYIVGTPAFMAPEMLSGNPARVDARTDVFLLGATLHHVLTGGYLNEGQNIQAVLFAVIDPPVRVYDEAVAPELAEVVRRACAQDPAERFESALAFREALTEHLEHRGSLALSSEALERVASLREELATATPDPTRVHSLGTEARFGLTQALRQWPGNDAARAGLREGLELLATHEIDRRQAEAARSILAELSSPPAALVARLAELDEQANREAERAAELEGFARQMDASVGATQRGHVMLAAFGLAAVLGALLIAHAWRVGVAAFSTGTLTAFSAVVFAGALVGVVLGRRQVAATVLNRHSAAVLLAALGAQLVNRLVATRFGFELAEILTLDLIVLLPALVCGSVMVHRRLWLTTAGVGLAAGIITLAPTSAVVVFGVASALLPFAALDAFRAVKSKA